MHPFFHTTPSQIAQLNDEQARELLARLCRAELANLGLEAAVTWSGDQRAADGGVDVRVEAMPVRELPLPLGRSVAVVQVKAENFGPKKIWKEMVIKGALRPAIAELAQHGGIYLIASTRDKSADPGVRSRQATMHKVLTEHGLADQVFFRYLGRRAIADWVERHPSVCLWVRKQVAAPLDGWRGYGAWAHRETDERASFDLGKEPRIFCPGDSESVSDLQALGAIRRDLRAGKAVRLVGLSGVGKTRLAQALFDPQIPTEPPALPSNWAVYTDAGDGPVPTPQAMLKALGAYDHPAVLIVDNCGQTTHAALVECKHEFAPSLGLLTIEYDIQDGIPEDTRCYHMEGVSAETLRSLLRDRYPQLSDNDLSTVVAASEGNARVAFALASTAEHTQDLASLNDRELFQRLFDQKAGGGDELLRCAQAASLLYSFDGESLEVGSEMTVLAEFAGVTPQVFFRHMATIKGRGLLQARGRMRALLPPAVSNRLASQALEETPLGLIKKCLVEDASDRVAASFVHRLSYLHTSPQAQALVASWQSPGGRYADLATMSHQEFRGFVRAAAVVPEGALSVIERFTAQEAIGARGDEHLDELISLCRWIAYDPALFHRSTTVLWALIQRAALVELGGKLRTNRMASLFQVWLSGSHAGAEQRAKVIDGLLGSDRTPDWSLGAELLSTALKTSYLRREFFDRFGARKRDYGWRPSSRDELRMWHAVFLDLVARWGLADGERGRQVRKAILDNLEGLLTEEATAGSVTKIALTFRGMDGWSQAWVEARRLSRDPMLSQEVRVFAEALEQALGPADLYEEVAARFHSDRDWHWEYASEVDDYDEQVRRAAERCEELGRLLAAGDRERLKGLLPSLLIEGNHEVAEALGRGLGRAHPNLGAFIDDVERHLRSANPNTVSIRFLYGVVETWAEANPGPLAVWLDRLAIDEQLAPYFPELQAHTSLDKPSVARVLRSLAVGRTPVVRYAAMAWNSLGEQTKAADWAAIVSAIADKGEDGVRTGILLLQHLARCAHVRDGTERLVLARYMKGFLLHRPWPDLVVHLGMLENRVERILKFCVAQLPSFEELADLLPLVVGFRAEEPLYPRSTMGSFIAPILQKYPYATLTALQGLQRWSVETIGEILRAERDTALEGQGRPAISDDALFDWCAADMVGRLPLTMQIGDLAPPQTNSPSLFQRLFEISNDKASFFALFRERGLEGDGRGELAYLKRCMLVLNQLQVVDDVDGQMAKEAALDALRERLSFWDHFDREGVTRARPETFE
ncbi:hypothetical protein [Lysobacter enzymogenes]|uniref:hypothetical protein n=1 Tax=Lysobacter enzymogenes TaxID=69 RepID=UPI001A977A80|nr:hypothetical protein [Lysobacter enzymogenes]QQP97960.1 hypothetical protein JHW38_08140 [Lysobacter enzymogenes]